MGRSGLYLWSGRPGGTGREEEGRGERKEGGRGEGVTPDCLSAQPPQVFIYNFHCLLFPCTLPDSQ